MNETLKALREQNNYSQAAVASYLDVSRQMYIKYENGEAVPPVKVVKQLSNFYRVPYEVILEDKLNHKFQSERDESKNLYDKEISDDEAESEVNDSCLAYGAAEDVSSYYLKSILEMLPKLVYREQLKLLERLSGLVQKATEEKLKPNKQIQSYIKLSKYADKLHLKSDGKKWTREELYER